MNPAALHSSEALAAARLAWSIAEREYQIATAERDIFARRYWALRRDSLGLDDGAILDASQERVIRHRLGDPDVPTEETVARLSDALSAAREAVTAAEAAHAAALEAKPPQPDSRYGAMKPVTILGFRYQTYEAVPDQVIAELGPVKTRRLVDTRFLYLRVPVEVA